MMRLWLRVLVLLCLSGFPAWAQTTPDVPLMGSEASPNLPTPAIPSTAGALDGGADGIYRILVVGDGLAGGLGAGLTRMAQDEPNMEVLNRFNESSGLARPELYDWPLAISKIVFDKSVDAIVVLVGVNDRQGIRDGGSRLDFKAPEWEAAYKTNVDRLIEAAGLAQAKIYWVSIPPMADAAFDADMKYLSLIHQTRVIEKKGAFIDIRPFFLAADGTYVDRGPDFTGVERKLRARDGINFFKAGNDRFGQLVLGAIKTLNGAAGTPIVKPVEKPTDAVAVANPSNPDLAKTVEVAPQTESAPSFGQQGIDGEDVTFKADTVVAMVAPAKKPVEAKADVSGATTILLTAKIGSQSEKLLRDGMIPPAPAGRFDDVTEEASSNP
jgi:hypothetical protein